MKKFLKQKISQYSKRFQFTQGMALGLTISSFLAYGVVNITNFAPGTKISSAAVNANFQELKVAVQELQMKQVGTFPSAYNVGCVSSPSWVSVPSYPGDYSDIPFDVEDSLTGQMTPNEFAITIPADGLYQISYNLPNASSVPVYKYISVNDSPVSVPNYLPDGSIVKKLNSNDYVKVEASCTTNFGSTSTLSQDAVILIKKI